MALSMMSRDYGPIRQLGFVVDDLDRAIDEWVRVWGVGPFFRITSLPLVSFRYLESTVAPDLSIGLANFGDIQIELIEQKNSASSPFLDFLAKRGPGLHHICVWTDDYLGELSRLASRGIVPDLEGETGNFRYCFFNSSSNDGTAIEFCDLGPGSEDMLEFCRMIRESALQWDGEDPIRDIVLP